MILSTISNQEEVKKDISHSSSPLSFCCPPRFISPLHTSSDVRSLTSSSSLCLSFLHASPDAKLTVPRCGAPFSSVASIVLRFAGRRCAPVRRLADKQRAGDHKSLNIREAANVICQAARCRQTLCCGFMDSENIINVEGAKRRDVVWQIWSLRCVLMSSVMIVSAPSTFSDTCAAKCHASVLQGLRKN